MSQRYKLNKEDGIKIAKVLMYASASAVLTAAIEILPQIEVPAVAYALLIPVINVALVSLKKYIENK